MNRGCRKGQGPPKRFGDRAHVENALKQRRWRNAHPDLYEKRKEKMRVDTVLRKRREPKTGYLVYELLDDESRIVHVVFLHVSHEVPNNARLSALMPNEPVTGPLARKMCGALKRLIGLPCRGLDR
jgi:hypothetical protein